MSYVREDIFLSNFQSPSTIPFIMCSGPVKNDINSQIIQLLIYTTYRIGIAIEWTHYNDVIMGKIASQISSLTTVYQPLIQTQIKEKTSKLRVTGLCAENSPGSGEFPAQMTSNAENVTIWRRHHAWRNIMCQPPDHVTVCRLFWHQHIG